MSKSELRKFRGDEMAMVFQDPMTSLNPVLKIGYQLGEAIKTHYPKVPDDTVKSRVVELLRLVGVPNPDVRAEQYPHEFSGGMRQRAMIAMAIANSPSLLIADEPTTALDVTIQAQVLEVLKNVQAETHAATILITHDLGIVAELCERVIVMYGGRIVEMGRREHDLPRAPPPVHDRPHGQPPEADRGRGMAAPDPGISAVAHQPAVRLRVPPACFLTQGRARCHDEVPELRKAEGTNDFAACHFSDELIGHHSKFSEAVGATGGQGSN